VPLDHQVKVLLDFMKGAPSFSELSPASARKQTNDMRALRSVEPSGVAHVEDRPIVGLADSMPVRICTPADKGAHEVSRNFKTKSSRGCSVL
jgi:hypothetical protein